MIRPFKCWQMQIVEVQSALRTSNSLAIAYLAAGPTGFSSRKAALTSCTACVLLQIPLAGFNKIALRLGLPALFVPFMWYLLHQVSHRCIVLPMKSSFDVANPGNGVNSVLSPHSLLRALLPPNSMPVIVVSLLVLKHNARGWSRALTQSSS